MEKKIPKNLKKKLDEDDRKIPAKLSEEKTQKILENSGTSSFEEKKSEGKHKVPGISSSDSEESSDDDSSESSKKGQEKISAEKIDLETVQIVPNEPPKIEAAWPPVHMWPVDLIHKWAFRTPKQMKREPQLYDQVPVNSVAERLITIKGDIPVNTYYNVFCQVLTRAGFLPSAKTCTETPDWPLIFLLFEKVLDCGPTQLSKKQKKTFR